MSKFNLILLFFCTLIFTNAFSCNCNTGGSIELNVKSADVIVKAKIISISYSDRLDTLGVRSDGAPNSVFAKYWKFQVKIYKASVLVNYKGKLLSDTISIVTGVNGATCGLTMEINKEYIVYGFKKDYLGFSSVQRRAVDDKLIWTNNCTRTWNFSDIEENDVKLEIEKQTVR